MAPATDAAVGRDGSAMVGGRRFRWSALAVLGVLFGATAFSGLVPGRPPTVVAACPVAGAVDVVLDPGHGGVDPGALNEPFGLVEKELTLAVAEQAAAILRARGHAVALTRTDGDTGLGNSERGAIANACGARAFVSIHFNSFDDPVVNYTKSFWGVQAKDQAFSRVMDATLFAALQPGTDLADGGVEEFESGALLRATMPSTLVETVFLSNPDEAARLANPDGARLARIAAAIAAGVEAWLAGS